MIGTAIGAAMGGLFGGAEGAAVGAAFGLAGGAIVGSDASYAASSSLQRRYDHAFTQCMYGKGHKVPVPAGRYSTNGAQPATPAAATTPAGTAPARSAARLPPEVIFRDAGAAQLRRWAMGSWNRRSADAAQSRDRRAARPRKQPRRRLQIRAGPPARSAGQRCAR